MSRAVNNKTGVRQHDETLAADGSLLPGWQMVKAELDALSDVQILRRQKEIARQLRSNGVAFSPLSNAEGDARPWNLDLAPFVIEPDDWQQLTRALDQRARLKEAILADIYGKQDLLASGSIPPAMVFAHSGYQRDAVNPAQSITLPMFSADVSRSPSGQWYVVDDICQYPAGAGYALENRLVISRTLPRLFKAARVSRVASFFKQLQQLIAEIATNDGRCVMLAPGTADVHYFEYAYLAKYLGYTLVQVEDITIRGDHAYLKTVSGLQRVSIILRFVDDTNIDPLAVGQTGGSGVTGLFQAVKAGGVKVINPLGTGVLNNPALNICLPSLCEKLLGESLMMQGAPTYWLGDDEQRQHVLSHVQDLLFRDIDSTGQLHDPLLMDEQSLDALKCNIELFPERFVAQERIDRSLAPGFSGTERVLQQITVRMFLVRGVDGYSTMPGGLCLLDTSEGGRRPSFTSLIGSKDTWVVADGPVKATSLLATPDRGSSYAMLSGELPSRVAENLFWMGRNAERCESCARLLSAVFQALQQHDAEAETGIGSPMLNALLRATSEASGTLPGFVGRGGKRRLANPEKELLSMLHDPYRFGTLPAALSALDRSAATVRDRISDELLHVLNRLDDTRAQLVATRKSRLFAEDSGVLDDVTDQLQNTLTVLSAFAGLAHENFNHGDGWHFMMLGRRIERLASTATIVKTMLAKERDDTLLLETMLRLFDSVMTYRSRYRSQIEVQPVLELVLLDEYNPRSLAYQLSEIDKAIDLLPNRRVVARTDPLARLAISGISRARLANPHSLLTNKRDSRQNLAKFLTVLQQLSGNMSEVLTANYFAHIEAGQQLSDIAPSRTTAGNT